MSAPCWADLGAPDIAKAREFYSDVFSWMVQPGGPETGGYSVAELNGRGVAGIGPKMLPPEAPVMWMTYLATSDAVFGYEYGDMSGDGFSYATFKVDGKDVGGIGDLHAGVPAGTSAGWRLYFGAADTDASVARVQANGGSVTREPIDHPYGRMATWAPTTRALSSPYSASRPGKTARADGRQPV